jgi:hypothetical protein
MDHITFVLAVIATLSETLPLIGWTKANGILHGVKEFILHVHADSDCHVDVMASVTTAPALSPPPPPPPPDISPNPSVQV